MGESPLDQAVVRAFSGDGALAKAVSAFIERPEQTALARSVARAIDADEVLIAEAGTGIGKTFAYLVPALLSGKRVLISTGTKNLQDQLFNRDLPAVVAALGTGVTIALLKGRSNYVCRHHLARNLQDGRFTSRQDVSVLHRIDRFAQISRSGDRAEAPGIAEDAPAWMHATSTRENCLGQDCEQFEQCFVVHARRRALAADVVVINHHLFCADLALRDGGVSELLPRTDLLVFDEAHQLPETATTFFGEAVSTRQFVDFSRDLTRTGLADARDAGDWLALADRIEQRLRELRLAAGQPRRIDEGDLAAKRFAPLLAAWQALADAMTEPVNLLTAQAERSRDIERLAVRGSALVRSVTAWIMHGSSSNDAAGHVDTDVDAGMSPVIEASGDDRPIASDEKAGSDTIADAVTDRVADPVADSVADPKPAPASGAGTAADTTSGDVGHEEHGDDGEDDDDAGAVYWIDIGRQGVSLHKTPLTVTRPFRRQRAEQRAAWILTSATLAVGARFDLFQSMLGLDDARCEQHDSPFDFARQALLYVPAGLPEPRHPDFPVGLVDAIEPLIRANRGRAFVLCTSLRMVDTVAARLAERLDDSFTLLVQGTDSREVLLQRFREVASPVLVGSASFWEGVDVVGAQLSLVVIDKLPFAPPDDPIVAARARALKVQGRDPFRELHLPYAAMALKQGAGRLIRSESDRGLLVIGDVRLADKNYGRQLLKSMPPFPRTRDASVAMAFLEGQ